MNQNLNEIYTLCLFDQLCNQHIQINLIKSNCIYLIRKKQWTPKKLATLVSLQYKFVFQNIEEFSMCQTKTKIRNDINIFYLTKNLVLVWHIENSSISRNTNLYCKLTY